MNKETFTKVIEIMPLTHDGWSLFSCGFESTIHPQFLELFESIPYELRKKPYFATNLAKKFTMEELNRISKLSIGVFNISFESFNPEIYEDCRKGAKFDTFIHNVEIITKLFKENTDPPILRFISLLFKQNINEVPSIAQRCQEEYGATINEFRTPFPWTIEYNNPEWMAKSLISPEEWTQLSERLIDTPYNILLKNYTEDNEVVINSPVNLNFFINSDGSTKFLDPDIVGDLNGFNINSVDDPYNYLKDKFDKILEENNEQTA